MSGRSDFEERRAARIDRLRARAEKMAREGRLSLASAQRISAMIPFGQPILVGHHSEKRHRKDLERIHNSYDRGYQAINEAQALESRARSAELNRSISSDDPNAPERVREKIAKLEKFREDAKVFNACVRKCKGNAEALLKLLHDKGFPQMTLQQAATLLLPDAVGNVGVPSYKLTNTGAEIRRLQARLKVLEHAEKLAALPDEHFGEIVLREEDNRTQLIFPGKPSEAIRSELKSHGFRWAPSTGAWQRLSNASARHHAKRIAERAQKESGS